MFYIDVERGFNKVTALWFSSLFIINDTLFIINDTLLIINDYFRTIKDVNYVFNA